MGDKTNIIKKLVKVIDETPVSPAIEEENLPIEYYEMREIAKIRVLLKSSLKSHSMIYLLVNIFIVLLNLYLNYISNGRIVSSLNQLWVLWSLLGWGLILWAHATIIFTMNINNLEHRIFVIISLVSVYVAGFLVFVNYFANEINTTPPSEDILWWYWPLGGIVLFIGAYAWIQFYSENRERLNSRVMHEYEQLKIKKKTQERKIKEKQVE